ncbi:MAG: nitronate monooxygenase [Gammaproteobacteria bacterium]|jgi:NAD(P)H-dependent flavin oxidoreductase YrpB (nitropropane dioxygenase family)|nr:nitronate monooxygenase [Gammaproteobacteria bacterium]
MKFALCEELGIDFPLFAFSHCRDVVAEVSRAGGFGVLGAAGHTPESLEIELAWIDEHVDGKPYGVDLIVPTSMDDKEGNFTPAEVEARIPPEHKAYVERILAENGVSVEGLWNRGVSEGFASGMREKGAAAILDVAFAHPIKLIVNALGVPPKIMMDRAREAGVKVGALTGAKEHAIKHAEAGVDILVVSGTEAGGHCGEISTLVLVPEVIEALEGYDGVDVLAAGGIVTGKQMAACMAMGAAGAWTGSVWLTTAEAETNPVVKEKMLAANSRQTVRSRSRTGKYTRQLRSAWTDAWQAPDAPEPLPMPLQSLVSEPALRAIDKLAQGGDVGARNLATYWVGQGVGLMNQPESVRSVVMTFMEDFAAAAERLGSYLED